VNDPEVFQEFGSWLREERDQKGLKYVEIRPLNGTQGGGLEPSRSYAFHELDLEPSLEEVFARLHRDSIQRRIQRAAKEQITYDVGASSKNLCDFYRLLLKTRRRHRLLPQPLAWFENLVACMGDRLEIRVARKNATPVAAILTLRHKTTVVYKYGCSDHRFHNFGAMPFLFWRLIDESKSQGMKTLDFGRSDLDQESLMAFKDRFGTRRTTLTYYRYPKEKQSVTALWSTKAVGQLCYFLPERAFALAGKIVYPHIG
jgi:lipid II:glycine glycyltransferase (peptidoglycan interpeptide bridge formation enzyme)